MSLTHTLRHLRRHFAACRVWLAAALLLAPTVHSHAQRNDNIYPPLPAAKKAIDFDGRGFIVNGRRTFISSGSIHYPRVPRELWADRLLRLQRASFNTVETYAFWNYHERREGAFDFTGNGDIGAFFETAQRMGLYGIARVGPYVCAEWDFGGYPIWMKFKPDVVVRTDNPQYLALNDRWYDHILPIVAAHQVNRGGNIILVQLENEHPKGWGVVDAPYFRHLNDKAAALGLEVPHFMSGLNHGAAPSGPRNPDTANRTSPWFSTEFWAGWFNLYGPVSAKKLRDVENAQWMIMAHGGAGQNFYMLHGGTNFETWNDPSGAASYDYGAAIGQAGDLRPMYYRMKRANQLAQSFPEILADGADVSKEYDKDWITGARVAGARRSSAGTIVFVTNPGKSEATVQFKDGTRLCARAGETFPVVLDATIAPGVKIAESTVRVLAVARHDNTVTVIVHGRPGDTGRLVLSAAGPLKAGAAATAFALKGADSPHVELTIKAPDKQAEECTLEGQGIFVRVLALSSDLGLYTWLVGQPGKQYVVCGPAFVREVKESGGACSAVIERPYGVPSCQHVAIYGPQGRAYHLAAKADTALDAQPAPALAAWQMSTLRESDPDFADAAWKKSEDPQQMGADGDISAFAWYRAEVTAPAAGSATLQFKARGNGNLAAFVNGAPVPVSKSQSQAGPFLLKAGKNTIAVFTSHAGRNKAFAKMEILSNFDNKGLFGPVILKAGQSSLEVKGWRLRGGVRPDEPGRQWSPLAKAAGRPTLFKTTFTAAPPGALGAHPVYRAEFKTLTRGTMWLNGHNLGRYPEKIPVASLYLPECWLKDGANELVVFDEEGADPTGIRLGVEQAASREVFKVSEPVDPATDFLVPQENPPRNLEALNKGNLAFRCPATASASRPDGPAGAATDGDIETAWLAPGPQPGAWLCVDLGRKQTIRSCEIAWEQAAKFYEYTLEVSTDGRAWSKIGDQTTAVPTSPDSPSELSRIKFPAARARYFRVTVTGGLNKKRFPMIAEFRVFEN